MRAAASNSFPRSTDMLRDIRIILVTIAFGWGMSSAAHASSYIFELYSNGDGSVQFLMLFTGIPVRAGQALTARSGSAEHSFAIPSSSASGSPITLIGTQAFADLNLVTPDFVVP